jgi:hypothetical protein
MCGIAERPLRLGWNSRSTNVGSFLRPVHVDVSGRGCLMSHIQSEPIAGTAPARSALMVANGPGHSPAKLGRSAPTAVKIAKLSGAYIGDPNLGHRG